MVKRTFRIVLLALFAGSCIAYAQTEPEAPGMDGTVPPKVYKNGFQLGLYGGLGINEYYEPYNILNVVTFLDIEHSVNAPYGVWLNIPVFEDFSLYLRAGYHKMKTTLSNGAVDTLESFPTTGAVAYDMDFYFDLLQVDILLRLIGKQDGERVYVGIGLGYVQQKRTVLTKEELLTGFTQQLRDEDMPGADDFFPQLIIGGEYAFVFFDNLYVIPAVEVNYGWEKVSDYQDLRGLFYKFLVSVSYQLF